MGVERFDNPEVKEQPMLSKVVLLVRHPSVKWVESLFSRAEEENQDIETHVPVDTAGLALTRRLSHYFKENLGSILQQGELEPQFSIFTSPIKRAKTEADIVSTNLKLSHTDDSSIPTPANNEPVISDLFGEVPWVKNKDEALSLRKESESRGIPLIQCWYERNPALVRERFSDELERVKQALEELSQSSTDFNIAFSHRLTIAMVLWLIEKGGQAEEVTDDDAQRILEIGKEISHTSISELRQFEDAGKKQWQIVSVGATPHIEQNGTVK